MFWRINLHLEVIKYKIVIYKMGVTGKIMWQNIYKLKEK